MGSKLAIGLTIVVGLLGVMRSGVAAAQTVSSPPGSPNPTPLGPYSVTLTLSGVPPTRTWCVVESKEEQYRNDFVTFEWDPLVPGPLAHTALLPGKEFNVSCGAEPARHATQAACDYALYPKEPSADLIAVKAEQFECEQETKLSQTIHFEQRYGACSNAANVMLGPSPAESKTPSAASAEALAGVTMQSGATAPAALTTPTESSRRPEASSPLAKPLTAPVHWS